MESSPAARAEAPIMIKSSAVSAALVALVVATDALAGQNPPPAALPTVLEGLTLDAQSGLPFPNIQIRFDTGERVTSDEAGRFSIDSIAPGYHRVALVTGRCNVTFADLEVAPGAIKRIAFAVPSEMVGITPSPKELKTHSEGDLYTTRDLQEMKVRNLLDALRRVAPDMVGPVGGQPGMAPSLMGRTRTAQGVAAPLVVVDGIVVVDGPRALQDLDPDEVASLEVLRGASRGWTYGTGAAGGVIRVVTRNGDVGYGIETPDRCDIGDWVHAKGSATGG
jgi:TonB-dependent starch-binding outer membrane protein SusC